jgi:hypothetical protein
MMIYSLATRPICVLTDHNFTLKYTSLAITSSIRKRIDKSSPRT